MVKISGADFKAFYRDDDVWVDDAWWEEAYITVNGVDIDDDTDLSQVADHDVLVVRGGYIQRDAADQSVSPYWKDGQLSIGFEAALKKWLQARTHTTLVVRVPHAQAEALRELAAQHGWQVL